MWKTLAECVAGTAHTTRNLSCQDACAVAEIATAEGSVLIVAIADGAGSASFPEVGAQLTARALLATARAALEAGVRVQDTDSLLPTWFRAARDEVVREAEARQVRPRELACTAILALVGESDAAFGQIGDGAVIVSEPDGYTPVFWPEAGEYANATTFLTDDTGLDSLMRRVGPDRIEAFAAFTDGLQRLALDYTIRKGHPGFFAPLFATLQSGADPAALSEPFRAFLNSSRVNDRTDDDKTLVLAVRHSPP